MIRWFICFTLFWSMCAAWFLPLSHPLLSSYSTSAFWCDFCYQVFHSHVLQTLFSDNVWRKTNEHRASFKVLVSFPGTHIIHPPLQWAFSWSFQPDSTSFVLSNSFNLKARVWRDKMYQSAFYCLRDLLRIKIPLTSRVPPFLSASG